MLESGISLNLATLPDGRTAAIIRTSDRIAFKQCRRKWGWSSHLKYNLGPKQLAAPLWFGSAIHYALEDYHGYNHFGSPKEAFKAYCIATAHNFKRDLPPDAQEHYEMGKIMMDYYTQHWLGSYGRHADQTYWAPNPDTGVLEPQVEVNFEIPIPVEPGSILDKWCKAQGIDVVLYRGTIDRVAVDEYGNLWIVEYKTAKVLAQMHYQTDPQITTYVWAAQAIYPDREVVGVIYHQFIKKTPQPPKILSTGKLSAAANLVTSAPLYKEQLVNMYGDVMKSPSKNQEFYNRLLKAENGDRDRYIVRDRVFRNEQQTASEGWKILMELEDMLNPDLPLYPNPTRDCSRMCSFLTPCVNMDDGSDWEGLLEEGYSSRDQDMERFWRQRLPDPKILFEQTYKDGQEVEPDLHGIQIHSLESYKAAEIAAGEYPLSEWEQKADPFEGVSEDGSFNMADVNTSL